MKKKINHELTPRESRLAEEAVGIKRDKNGKFAKVAEYKQDVERITKELNVCHKDLANAEEDATFYKFAGLTVVIATALLMVYTILSPYVIAFNDFIINLLMPLYD